MQIQGTGHRFFLKTRAPGPAKTVKKNQLNSLFPQRKKSGSSGKSWHFCDHAPHAAAEILFTARTAAFFAWIVSLKLLEFRSRLAARIVKKSILKQGFQKATPKIFSNLPFRQGQKISTNSSSGAGIFFQPGNGSRRTCLNFWRRDGLEQHFFSGQNIGIRSSGVSLGFQSGTKKALP